METVQRLIGRAPLRYACVRCSGHRNIQHIGGGQVLCVRLIHIIVALGVICQAVVAAHVDLSRGDTCYLKATLLLHLRASHLGLGLVMESGRGGSGLGCVVVSRADSAATGCGGRAAAAPPEVVRFPAPGPRWVSGVVLVVHLHRHRGVGGQEAADGCLR